MLKLVLGAIGFVACVTPALGDVVYSDGNFNASDWGFETVQTGGGGSSVASQVATGSPGTARRLQNIVNDGASHVYGFSRFGTTAATRYDPATQGAIAGVDLSIDFRFVEGLGGQGHGLTLGAKQGMVVYEAGYTTTGSTGQWGNWTVTGLTAADFSPIAGGPAIDFSASGAFIRFGFIVGNSTQADGYTNTVDYDNFVCTVHQAPAPAGGLVLAGLAGVASRRRRA